MARQPSKAHERCASGCPPPSHFSCPHPFTNNLHHRIVQAIKARLAALQELLGLPQSKLAGLLATHPQLVLGNTQQVEARLEVGAGHGVVRACPAAAGSAMLLLLTWKKGEELTPAVRWSGWLHESAMHMGHEPLHFNMLN